MDGLSGGFHHVHRPKFHHPYHLQQPNAVRHLASPMRKHESSWVLAGTIQAVDHDGATGAIWNQVLVDLGETVNPKNTSIA
jgi:hypothetical protein